MVWTTEIINNWYWLVMALFVITGLAGSWQHNKALPVVWGCLMACVLWIGANALDPMLFGALYYPMYSLEWLLTSVFAVSFMILNGTFMYNVIKTGQVIE